MGAVLRSKHLEFWQIPIIVVACAVAVLSRNLASPILQLRYKEKVSAVIYSLLHSTSNIHVFANFLAPAALNLICCAGVLLILAHHLYTIRDSETTQVVLKGALVALLVFFLLMLAYQSLVLFSVALLGMLAVALFAVFVISALRKP